MNERIPAAANPSGRVCLAHTKLGEAYMLRMALGNIRTQREHAAEAWRPLREGASRATATVSPGAAISPDQPGRAPPQARDRHPREHQGSHGSCAQRTIC